MPPTPKPDRLVTLNHPCGRMIAPQRWSRPRSASRALTDHELWLVWRGRCRMGDGQQHHDLGPGSLVWMRPGGTYDAKRIGKAPLGFTFIHFMPQHIDAPGEYFGPIDLTLFEPVTRRIVELVPRSPSRPWGRPADAPAHATRLLEALLLDLLDQAHRPTHDPQSTLAKVRRLGDQLRIDPVHAPTVAELADRLHISPAHFSRLFRQAHGQSPQRFLIDARLDRARHLLRETGMSISDIADVLGYPDPFTFSKQFKRFSGQSPRGYRAHPQAGSG